MTPWRARDRALRRSGWDVTTLSPRRSDEGGQVVELDRAGDGFVEPIGTLGTHPFWFACAPWTLWKALRRKPWVVLDLHEEPASLAVFEVLLIRWVLRLQTPVILFSAENLRKRYPPPFRWFERWALRTASAVYCCNAAAAENLRAKGFLGRLEVIGLGVDVERFSPRASGSGAHLGYVGRLDERKGVQIAISALAQLPAPTTLTIAGAGPYEPALRSLVQQLDVQERVRFVSYVANEDLPSLYRSFDLVVVPSLPTPRWEEQFCRVAVEAMASGVPVLASRSGALPEVVGDGGLLLPPGDVTAWSEAVRSVLGDAPQRRALAQQAVCRAQRYSWDVIAEQHAALYDAVTA